MRPLQRLLVVCAVLLGPGAGDAAAQALPAAVAQALTASGLAAERLALVVLPASGDAPAFAWRDDVAMPPASTMKLVTSAAALDLLGPNHRGSTELHADGTPQGGAVSGNVYLRGLADTDFDVPALWQLLYTLRTQGVRRIRGDVVIDRHFFAPARTDQGLPPFDESPEWQYNVIPDALSLAGGVLPYRLAADSQGVRVTVTPKLAAMRLHADVAPIDGRCKDWEDGWLPPVVSTHPGASQPATVDIRFRGTFPRQCERIAELQLFDRDLMAELLIRQLWRDMGGRIDGRVVAGRTPTNARLIARHDSRPLAEVLRHMNKASDNPQTRLVFLSIGAFATGTERGPWLTTQAASIDRVTRWLAGQGIDTSGLVLDNGSGLSRSERISPRQLATMLRNALAQPWAPELVSSMPLVGVDGTMRNRLKQSPAAGHARIKTGTLRNVDGVAGYVTDINGRQWVVAAMQGHEHEQKGRVVLDALLDWVARGQPAAMPAYADATPN